MSREEDYKNNLEQEQEKAGANNPQADQQEQRDRKKQAENKSARSRINPKKIVKNIITSISLISLIELTDIFFLVAVMAAMVKDVLDCFVIPALPVIGTALTLMASITIMAAMFVCGASSANRSQAKKLVGKALKKYGTLVAGTSFEFFFGLNFIPTETFTAFLIFYFILQERKEAREEQKQEQEENTKMARAYA
jgi:hypothetical protein